VPGDVALAPDGACLVRRGDLALRGVADAGLTVGSDSVAMPRPEDGVLYAAPPTDAEAGGHNLLAGDIVYSEFLGGRWRHVVAVSSDVAVQVLTPTHPPNRRRVWVGFPVDRCVLLPPAGGRAVSAPLASS